jgi:hypothetical protein
MLSACKVWVGFVSSYVRCDTTDAVVTWQEITLHALTASCSRTEFLAEVSISASTELEVAWCTHLLATVYEESSAESSPPSSACLEDQGLQ